jgi:hypothetical protein
VPALRGQVDENSATLHPRQAPTRPGEASLRSLAKSEHATEPLHCCRHVPVCEGRNESGRLPRLRLIRHSFTPDNSTTSDRVLAPVPAVAPRQGPQCHAVATRVLAVLKARSHANESGFQRPSRRRQPASTAASLAEPDPHA